MGIQSVSKIRHLACCVDFASLIQAGSPDSAEAGVSVSFSVNLREKSRIPAIFGDSILIFPGFHFVVFALAGTHESNHFLPVS